MYGDLPEYMELYTLLEKLQDLMLVIDRKAMKYEKEKSSGAEPAEETAFVGESMAELSESVGSLKEKLDEKYNIVEENDDFTPEQVERSYVESQKPKIIEKYEELKEWQSEEIEDLRKHYPDIDEVETKNGGTHVLVTHDGEDYYLDNAADGAVSDTPEYVVEFVKERGKILEERESRFISWMEEKGFDHKDRQHAGLPIHRFIYDTDFDDLTFEIEVPHCAPREEVIEIHSE